MMKKYALFWFACSIFLMALPMLGTGGQQDIDKIYRIAKGIVLKWSYPLGWVDEITPSTDGSSYTIRLSNSSFVINTRAVITVFLNRKGKKDFNSPQQIKSLMEEKGNRLLSGAVEEKLVLETLKGKTSIGYHYLLTDKAPNPGNYKYLIQGGLGVGEMLLMYTIFSNSKESKFIPLLFKMLRGAEQFHRE